MLNGGWLRGSERLTWQARPPQGRSTASRLDFRQHRTYRHRHPWRHEVELSVAHNSRRNLPIRVAGMMDDDPLCRVDDQVMADAWNREIFRQLVASIVALRRRRGNFDDDERRFQDHRIEVRGDVALYDSIRLTRMLVVY